MNTARCERIYNHLSWRQLQWNGGRNPRWCIGLSAHGPTKICELTEQQVGTEAYLPNPAHMARRSWKQGPLIGSFSTMAIVRRISCWAGRGILANILGYSIPYLRGEWLSCLMVGVREQEWFFFLIDLLWSHRVHIYIYSIGHVMCAQTMFGRAWHALSTVRSQAL